MNQGNSIKPSVIVPPPKSWISEDGIKFIIGVLLVLVFSLASAVAFFCSEYSKESEKNEMLSRDKDYLLDKVAELSEENSKLVNDVFRAFQIRSERSRGEVWECVNHPKGRVRFLDWRRVSAKEKAIWNEVLIACLTKIKDRDALPNH